MSNYKIIGYHGTKQSACKNITNFGFKINKSKEDDNHWLGHGVYFYDDFKLAKSWATQKVNVQNKKYNKNDRASVIKVDICSKNILNLNDNSEVDKYFEFLEEFIYLTDKHKFKLEDKSDEIELEKFNCIALDYYAKIKKIDVIIRTFKSNRTNYYDIKHKLKKDIMKILKICYIEKQICVKNIDVIKNIRIVYEAK